MFDNYSTTEQSQEDKSITLSKNESYSRIDTSLFKFSWTYLGYCNFSSEYLLMKSTIEVPIITGLLKKVFGEKIGNLIGKFELPVTCENYDSIFQSGYYLKKEHPNFLKLIEK